MLKNLLFFIMFFMGITIHGSAINSIKELSKTAHTYVLEKNYDSAKEIIINLGLINISPREEILLFIMNRGDKIFSIEQCLKLLTRIGTNENDTKKSLARLCSYFNFSFDLPENWPKEWKASRQLIEYQTEFFDWIDEVSIIIENGKEIESMQHYFCTIANIILKSIQNDNLSKDNLWLLLELFHPLDEGLQVNLLQFIINMGANVNAVLDLCGNTPLSLAGYFDLAHCCDYLIEKGANDPLIYRY